MNISIEYSKDGDIENILKAAQSIELKQANHYTKAVHGKIR